MSGPIRDLADASAWLGGLIDREKRSDWSYARIDLTPIRALLARVGNPQDALVVLHIAGSKGKGSVALACEALLRASGARVGTFTSPHLERWSERIRVDGAEIGEAALAAALERLRPEVEALRAGDPALAPSFFDATTAAALLCFRAAGVDATVLEVGLGGRLDSTNIVASRVACITGIELEHTDKLGTTLGAIAWEKAGILERGMPVLVGPVPEEARAVIAARAREVDAPARWYGVDFEAQVLAESVRGSRVRLSDGDLDCEIELPLLGAHQARNAALAFAATRGFRPLPDAAWCDHARSAFAGLRLPGRIEIVERDPLVVVDSAHTARSAQALAQALRALAPQRLHLVLSISAGKDLAAILDALLPLAARVTLTRADAQRSLEPAEIAQAVRRLAPGIERTVVPNPHLALRAAREGLGPGDALCAAGSFYLAGIARALWAPTSAAPGN